MDRNLLGLTLGPGLAIAIFIYWKDKLDPEPRKLLIRAFCLLSMMFIFSFLSLVF
jgi:predicted membrane channel-forming protein YqfA (hemolysin III family)